MDVNCIQIRRLPVLTQSRGITILNFADAGESFQRSGVPPNYGDSPLTQGCKKLLPMSLTQTPGNITLRKHRNYQMYRGLPLPNLPHFLYALRRFPDTAGQSLLSDNSSRPMYLNVSTLSRTWYRSLNSIPDAYRAAVTKMRWRICSTPIFHILVTIRPSASASHGINIYYWSHHG